ncbi:hypothetical protein ACHAP5_009314 [Fusarium lateritium]
MKFTASILAVLAITSSALASPAPKKVAPAPPPPPKPVKPVKQTNSCGKNQALYCCYTTEKQSGVSCAAFTNGGIGGICNGIQMCCNNQGSGSQTCGFNTGGGTITFSPSVGGGGPIIPLE